jgi:ketosteroid isomerase-like protein
MSQPNVEIVRRVYDAIDRGDAATVLALYDPKIEWDFARSPFRSLFKHDIYRGHDGLRSFIRERYEEAWESIDDELEELIDAGEHVISVITTRGRGRASGVEVKKTHAGIWTIRNGRIVRVEWMSSRGDALEAAEKAE